MALASEVICDSAPPFLPAARGPATSSSSSSPSWTALAILAVLPRLSVCQRTAPLPFSFTPLAPSPYQDQRPSHPSIISQTGHLCNCLQSRPSGGGRREQEDRGRREGQGTTGPHSTTHRCVFRYFVARKTLEGECYGRVLHIQVQRLGAHGHSRSSCMCSVHDPILFTTSCGLPRVRATMSISFKSTRRVDDRLMMMMPFNCDLWRQGRTP